MFIVIVDLFSRRAAVEPTDPFRGGFRMFGKVDILTL
jgi:hypothetical protein